MTEHTLLTPRDMMKRLNVSTRTVYRYVQEGRLPYLKIRGGIRFNPDSIKQFLKNTEVQPTRSVTTT